MKTLAARHPDPMAASKEKGAYATRQILSHLPEYLRFTIARHPRLYLGPGSIAFARYLGWPIPPEHPTSISIASRQFLYLLLLFWTPLLILAGFYLLAIRGTISALIHCVRHCHAADASMFRIAFGSALCSFLLLAAVIGPITATRYRFIMVPFLAMLAAFGSTHRPPVVSDSPALAPTLIQQLLRYFGVALVAFAVDFGTYALLVHCGCHYTIAAIGGFLTGLLTNYLLCKCFVFQEKTGSRTLEFLAYAIIGLLGLGLLEVLLYLQIGVLHIHYLIAKLIATGLVFIWNFAARKLLLYSPLAKKLWPTIK